MTAVSRAQAAGAHEARLRAEKLLVEELEGGDDLCAVRVRARVRVRVRVTVRVRVRVRPSASLIMIISPPVCMRVYEGI